MVSSVQGADDFWKDSGTPRNERKAKLKHDGIKTFSRISTTENDPVKKVRACAPKAA